MPIKSIMIVDEETDLLNQIKTLLANDNVEVRTVHNSREALDLLTEENEETFDLILVNTRMPGSQVTTALFSLKPAIKNQPTGIENFLQKPFTKEELLEFIKANIQQ
jgi:DNA-binding response OmpR family regulator